MSWDGGILWLIGFVFFLSMLVFGDNIGEVLSAIAWRIRQGGRKP